MTAETPIIPDEDRATDHAPSHPRQHQGGYCWNQHGIRSWWAELPDGIYRRVWDPLRA